MGSKNLEINSEIKEELEQYLRRRTVKVIPYKRTHVEKLIVEFVQEKKIPKELLPEYWQRRLYDLMVARGTIKDNIKIEDIYGYCKIT